ncbi:MAG TPA: hypothetical protein VET25_06580, partial [Aestuariivirgaceae bacterium]|nr:hypothetical protein [Aestuariivirgaceae bacterium]
MNRHEPPILNRREVLLALTLLSSGAGLAAQIAEAGAATAPEKYIQRIGNDVIALANSGTKGGALRTRFASLLQRHSDIRSIALFSLGTY